MLGRHARLLVAIVIAQVCATTSIKSAEPTDCGQSVINEALFQEARGDNHARAKLLRQAEQVGADDSAIHWARGKILLHDRWLTPEEIGEAVHDDENSAAYIGQRDAAGNDDAAAQWALAEWCKEHGLPLQHRAHVTRVLTLTPDHALARREAGFIKTKGSWTLPHDSAGAKTYADDQRAAVKKWAPTLARLGRQLLNGAETERQAAEREFSEIADLQAAVVFEQMYCATNSRLAALAITKMAAMDDPALSIALARQAVYSPWQETRDLAAEQLKHRPVEEYAPLMLNALSSPLEAHLQTEIDAYRRVAVHQRVQFESQYAHEVLVSQVNYLKPSSISFKRRTPITTLNLTTANRPTLFTDVANENLARIERNDRITRALATATGKSLGDEPQAWWKWWNETNELYTAEKPVVYQYYCTTYKSAYIWHMHLSCFAKGTPVWTVTGMRPIDEIKLGDLVLAKNVETGELAYRPVLHTTLRPPAAIVRIEAGDALKIDTTGGHRFWVSGEGWVKARDLKSGMPLHTATGVVIVSDVQEQPKAAAYNLVVADYHNYFVTDAKVLCQDNLMPRPTAVKVPGLKIR